MKSLQIKIHLLFRILLVVMLSLNILSACNLTSSGEDSGDAAETGGQVPGIPQTYAEVTFKVYLPQGTSADGGVFLDILDEITGLSLNPHRYPMSQVDSSLYSVQIPVVVGSVVKYKYTRGGTPPPSEALPNGKPVRYRMFYVAGPSMIQDNVSGWTDSFYQSGLGRIQGEVFDAGTGLPVPGVLITFGGFQTVSSSDGRFIIEDVAEGTHNLVAYSMDGSYLPFQQGAVIARDASTPAVIRLQAANMVEVKFVVRPPEDHMPGSPIRMIGNILSMGNTFADLNGGLSTVAARAPLLSMTSDGYYTISLTLPAGLDLRYKYTLGDGFWNAEHSQKEPFPVRQLIVPQGGTIVYDDIETWRTGPMEPVSFQVTAPPETLPEETVSIQFNPYGWTEPLPMWPVGGNQWIFILHSPLDMLGEVGYRFCRNDQCDTARVSSALEVNGRIGTIAGSQSAQTIDYTIGTWEWQQTAYPIVDTSDQQVNLRLGDFVTGIEFQVGYHPSWQPYLGNTIGHIQQLGANYLILTPTWTFTRNNLPVLEAVPGRDQMWGDLTQFGLWAQQKGLNLIIFPQTRFLEPAADWWMAGTRDDGWWRSWFDRYKTFVLHHADLAATLGAKAIVLGEGAIKPALPGGILPNGTPSGVPGTADLFWTSMLEEVRARFSGEIYWVIQYPQDGGFVPGFVSEVDKLYVLWTAKLSDSGDYSLQDLTNKFGNYLDTDILSLYNVYGKPVIIGLNYPSIDGASLGCIEIGVNCYPFEVINQPSPVLPENEMDLTEQADLYQAAFLAVNQRDWLGGVVSRGYYPPVGLVDKSSSIRQKPAESLIKFWFTGFLGQGQ